ncbi:MAG: hypothetical protein DRP52_03860, partial [Planctomycetota bacterium]
NAHELTRIKDTKEKTQEKRHREKPQEKNHRLHRLTQIFLDGINGIYRDLKTENRTTKNTKSTKKENRGFKNRNRTTNAHELTRIKDTKEKTQRKDTREKPQITQIDTDLKTGTEKEPRI